MFAIASLLDPVSGQAVQQFWKRFEVDCGLTGVKLWPLPHFSWQSAETLQFEPVENILREISRQVKPFHVCATNLGVFTGDKPIVYLGRVKNETLLHIHQMLWERLQPFTGGLNFYYNPENWIPHITLALYDVEPDRLACAVSSIAFQKIEMEILIDNFAVLAHTADQSGLKSRFGFSEEFLPMGEN